MRLRQNATAAGVAATIGAVARAVNTNIVSSRVQEIESETLGNLGNVCSYYRQRWISSGVVYSTYSSSGGVCP